MKELIGCLSGLTPLLKNVVKGVKQKQRLLMVSLPVSKQSINTRIFHRGDHPGRLTYVALIRCPGGNFLTIPPEHCNA